MAETTGISWADGTHNWWVGCQETGSPACVPCYAREWDKRHAPAAPTGQAKVAPHWGPHAPRRLTSPENHSRISLWNRGPHRLASAPPGTKPFVFGGSLMDFADNMVDPSWRADQFSSYRSALNLVFLMLTKRIGNVYEMAMAAGGWGPNMALGITVVTQKEADRDIPKLLECARMLREAGFPPLFLFLSVEPMAERVRLPLSALAQIAWVIVGGPTSQGKHKAWPIDVNWVRELRDDCAAVGTAFHFKQWGEFIPVEGAMRAGDIVPPGFDRAVRHVGKRSAGRFLDGVEHNARPMIALEAA